jgi:hypothetical protein
MLIKQPRGTAKLTIVLGTFCFRSTRIVTGRVAAELAVPQAVATAGIHLNQCRKGFWNLVKTKKRSGRMMNRCRKKQERQNPMCMPRAVPTDAMSTACQSGMGNLQRAEGRTTHEIAQNEEEDTDGGELDEERDDLGDHAVDLDDALVYDGVGAYCISMHDHLTSWTNILSIR